MIYAVLFVILFGLMLLYFRIADRFNIIDNPNSRSSHTVPTIRGGGIIFLISTSLFFFWSGFTYPYLLMAVLLSAIVSFIDDIRTVKNSIKFGIHVLSVILLFKQCGLLDTISFVYLVAVGILIIGIINAYNFMDGINGITGLYSLAIFIPLAITEPDKTLLVLDLFSIVALSVFNYFNTRKKASCFAGDVGSICLAILIVFLIINRIQATREFKYIGLLLIYGIDSIFTIIQRLVTHENIFKPHRKHLYQYYTNEKKIPHVAVSVIYASVQFIINLAIVYDYLNLFPLLILLIFLSITYWILKIPFLRRPAL